MVKVISMEPSRWPFLLTLLASVAVLLVLSGCNDPKKPNMELVHDMMEQDALKTQDFHPDDREKSGMYVPPEGTVPRGFDKHPYEQNDAEKAPYNLRQHEHWQLVCPAQSPDVCEPEVLPCCA